CARASARYGDLRLSEVARAEYLEIARECRHPDVLGRRAARLDGDLERGGPADIDALRTQCGGHPHGILRAGTQQRDAEQRAQHYQSRSTGMRRCPRRSLSRVSSRSSCSIALRMRSACSWLMGCSSCSAPASWPAPPCDCGWAPPPPEEGCACGSSPDSG